MDVSGTIPCRLCGGTSIHVFDKRVLESRNVAYFRCESCNSIETEWPVWLDEAYAIPPNHIDVGSGSRTVKNWMALTTLLGALSFSRDAMAVDFGSATGLLGRLMRDVGYNFHSFDKYASSIFSSYFSVDDPLRVAPKLITAFEVFEHLPEPRTTLDQLFSAGASLIVFTTWFCDGQNSDWVYFVEECGQHVFFYSEQAMRDIAGRHGYDLKSTEFFHVLIKRPAFSREQLAAFDEYVLNSGQKVRDAVVETFESVRNSNEFIDRDFEAARARFKHDVALPR